MKALILSLALAGTAHAAEAGDLVVQLTGRFDNAAQMAALAPDVATRPEPGKPWVAAVSAAMGEVAIPALPGRVIYLEWTNAEGAIDRQRLWTFEKKDGALQMRFFTFRDATPYAGALADQARLADVTPDMLIAYPPGCEGHVTPGDAGFTIRIDPALCTIVTQRTGRKMAVDAEIVVTATGFAYREAGILEDGTDAFRVPGTGAIQFLRKAE
jgi:hypothetical protein